MIKSIIYFFLFQSFVVCIFNVSASGIDPETQEKKAFRIVKQNAALLDSINQLLVVFNETAERNLATLVAMEKKGSQWHVASAPMQAGIGRKGFAAPNAKREGDNQSPTGFFRLGKMFCYEKEVDTKMPFIQSTPEDKWIDDPNSPDYNRYIRGTTNAKSYEKLLLNGNDYRYCMVIEYNTHPVVKGNGSAIFLHLSEGQEINSSSGCVVILQKDMEQLIKWMNPELKPSILMGTKKDLISGLKIKK
ncbi:MAG: L,D-transpeptidase family protein [Prolixibacteraceae bacterium]|nr:L,D-transpeptidase family protein [Prolixibacteraceae bacterium]